jgi:hypothetical protein
MSLRLASFSALAAFAALVASGACTSSVTLVDTTSTTGTGAGGGSSTTTTTTTTATGSSTTGGGTCSTSADCGCGCGCVNNACECTGVVPSTCSIDADCGPACAGLHCVAQKCEPSVCVGIDICAHAGDTRCVADAIETCTLIAGCLAWSSSVDCPSGQTCNSDATKCVTPPDICNDSSECACGCVCSANECLCAGGLPPDCTTDADCGPVCAGIHCVDNHCGFPK